MSDLAGQHLVHGDRPLRRDIRILTWQLRRLVRQHGGEDLWDNFEQLRKLAVRHPSDPQQSDQQIAALLAEHSVESLAELTRVAGLFFDLSNLAEDRHRVRVLHRRERHDALGESIEAAAHALSDLSQEQRSALLNKLRIEPVLTAHPTEAKRRSSRRATRRLRRDLRVLGRGSLLPKQRRIQLTRMQRDLASLWYTDPVSPRKPSVMEELGRTLFATRTMWRVTPEILSELRRSFNQPGLANPRTTHALRFGSWIGGDRDGNPNVTAQVTRQTLQRLRRTAARLHRRQCQMVRERLTISASRAGLGKSIQEHIEQAAAQSPSLRKRINRLHPEEWLVQWLTVIDYRLGQSQALPGDEAHYPGYINARALHDDVELIARTLREAGHHELLAGGLQRWHDRISTFGLHMLRLDIRINSTDLVETVDHLMRQTGQCANYAALDEAARRDALTQPLNTDQPWPQTVDDLPDVVADRWKLFGIIQQLCARGCDEVLGALVVSMTHRPSDALAAGWLLHACAHAHGQPIAPIPVSPLFETIDDLQRSGEMLHEMLSDATYREHVARCDQNQLCMVGYSDSAKDGGYLASNWALYGAQERLATIAQNHDVKLTIFHGRGGALGRGGGPAARAIHSLPPHAVDGRLRLTEQGEVIAERYDDPAIARRHLEQLFWATLTVELERDATVNADTRKLIDQFSSHAEQAYRDLVNLPQFVDFQRQCTALPLIEALPIGSRPSRRSGVKTLEDLRAIPFTFAWNQVRMPINAFYGLGAAFEQLSDDQQAQTIALYESWPWFRAVIDNAELALARCDATITQRYVALADDPDLALELWQALRDEVDRCVSAVLAIKQQPCLLAQIPWLDRTVRVRIPYLDMLNMIQIELMRRQRDGKMDQGDELDQALRGTVQALAAGLRNTG